MLVSLGLDFRRARLEVRERFHLEDADLPRVLDALQDRGAGEVVLTRTCNRLEAYCWWMDPSTDPGLEISRAWVGDDPREAEALHSSARLRHAETAAQHLFRVAAGLESQVLGDIHILGQLRRAFRDAVAVRAVGPHLHRLFETALRVGKQVQRETPLLANRRSVGSEAARFVAARAGGVAGRSCVVVGCGKSGTHAARALCELGATELTVINRTRERADALAQALAARRALGLESLPQALADAEVVVVATGAPSPLLDAEALRRARAGATRPLWIIDVSVPRNVEPEVAALPGVTHVDLDTLDPVHGCEESRLRALPRAEALVRSGVEDYRQWLELRAASHALRPLRELLAETCRREVAHLAGACPQAERTASRIVARVMAQPMATLRAAAERGEALELASGAVADLFPRARRAVVRARSG